jgi:Flp pilus assembly protein TadD
MKREWGRGFRGALAAAACGIIMAAGTAHAQGGARPDIRQQLNELAANPTSVDQLIGTGRAALGVGDAEAAVGFFTRALELAPRDWRAKAGLAAATAQAGQPESALVLFAEASAAGAPEADIAGDRGLAYDLTGQTARAQQDYTLSLRRQDDPEVRRRLALSLAASGQREAALRLLDPQVREGDRAAGRARAMVLALSGDVSGATAAAAQAMPPGAAQAMTPFFARLASLSPAQMVAAANLGRIPSSGGASYVESPGRASADPSALAFAGTPTARPSASPPPTLRGRLPVAPTETYAVRRRPSAVETARSEPIPQATLDAGQPRGSWPGTPATRSTNAVASTGAGFRMPHPAEPLPAALRGVVASAPDAVEPDADDPADDEADDAGQKPVELPARSGAVAMARVMPADPVSEQPAGGTSQPAGELDGAAANLAVWNRSGSVSAPPVRTNPSPTVSAWAPTATITARPAPSRRLRTYGTVDRSATSSARTPTPRSSFSDVASTVSSLDTARETTLPSRSRWRGRYSSRRLVANPVETTLPSSASRYGAGGSSWRRTRGSAGLTSPTGSASTYGTSWRTRGRNGLTSPTAATGTRGTTGSYGRTGRYGVTSRGYTNSGNSTNARTSTNSRAGTREGSYGSSATRRGASTASGSASSSRTCTGSRRSCSAAGTGSTHQSATQTRTGRSSAATSTTTRRTSSSTRSGRKPSSR